MTNIRSFSAKPTSFDNNRLEVLVASPGRINLIGEHTDYNEGFVMPTAIDKRITLKFQKNYTENFCRIFSETFNKGFEFHLDKPIEKGKGWENYILGVIKELKSLNANIEGFDCIIESKLPVGAGISSSAALECGIASGLNELFELGLEKLEIVKLAQKAENNFVGSNCGIMDQYSSVMSKENHIILLDCRNLQAEFIPADFKNCTLLLLNTNVSHNLADSDYNSRREECEAAICIIKREKPEIKSVRDLSFETLEEFKDKLNSKMYERCLYVLKENERVLKSANAIRSGNLKSFGKKDRDPGYRCISVAQYALIRIDEYDEKLVEEHGAHWYEIDDLPLLILDHNDMVHDALLQLKQNARYKPIGFELLPEKFTIPQLQILYEAIYQRELDARNFRKKVLSLNVLEKLDEKDKTTSKRGAFLYKFNYENYQKLLKSGYNFEIA